MSGQHEEDPFEKDLRRALAEAAAEVEPRGTLAGLRLRIRLFRVRHRRRRRLHKDARSAPEPVTLLMASVPDAATYREGPPVLARGRPPGSGEPWTGGNRGESARAGEDWRADLPPAADDWRAELHSCLCGRPCRGRWCCWMCAQAVDLTPPRSRSSRPPLHTIQCRERQRAYTAILAAGRPR